jgi:hypothetical protein
MQSSDLSVGAKSASHEWGRGKYRARSLSSRIPPQGLTGNNPNGRWALAEMWRSIPRSRLRKAGANIAELRRILLFRRSTAGDTFCTSDCPVAYSTGSPLDRQFLIQAITSSTRALWMGSTFSHPASALSRCPSCFRLCRRFSSVGWLCLVSSSSARRCTLGCDRSHQSSD